MKTHELEGNLVLADRVFYGRLEWEHDKIVSIEKIGEFRTAAQLILPGFIDIHIHGLGKFSTNDAENITGMAAFAPSTGVSGFCPTLATATMAQFLIFLNDVRRLWQTPPPGAKVLGSHLEGPFINPVRRGGMDVNMLRKPDCGETQTMLDAAAGSLRVMTISPELPGAKEVIRLLNAQGVTVSAGHTMMAPEALDEAVELGVRQVCHLFDTFDGRIVDNGVTQVSLADKVTLDDRLLLELIPDTFHVPPDLVRLTRRAAGADRLIGITDAMQGSGLADGLYAMPDGRQFFLNNAELCRLNDAARTIVGSCLTQNRAFYNLTAKLGFTLSEGANVLSRNPARAIGIDGQTGQLKVGLAADITVLDVNHCDVKACFVDGGKVFER